MQTTFNTDLYISSSVQEQTTLNTDLYISSSVQEQTTLNTDLYISSSVQVRSHNQSYISILLIQSQFWQALTLPEQQAQLWRQKLGYLCSLFYDSFQSLAGRNLLNVNKNIILVKTCIIIQYSFLFRDCELEIFSKAGVFLTYNVGLVNRHCQ